MLKSFYLLPLLALLATLMTGCATQYAELPAIPEYPAPARQFDSSATIELYCHSNKSFDEMMREKFSQCNYRDIISGTHYKSSPLIPIRIVAPLDLRWWKYHCQNGYYIELRLLVMVRQPGQIINNELQYTAPRYFQAYSQLRLQKDQPQPDEWNQLYQTVLDNLFNITEFREALEPTSKF